jgi:hypothetical protein
MVPVPRGRAGRDGERAEVCGELDGGEAVAGARPGLGRELEYASRDELLACLDHLLETAGNPSLMTTELKATLADHAAGNYRVLMNLGDELLSIAADRDLPRLDEKLFLDAFNQQPRPAKAAAKRR